MDTGFTILFHSSKTMRVSSEASLSSYSRPPLLREANEIATYMKSLDSADIASAMKISLPLAEKTHALVQSWKEKNHTLPAIDAFLGDMYSGLQAGSFTSGDRAYAQEHFYILSGLYGVVRALDCIHPYRLEMGYKLPGEPYSSLYKHWGDRIAKTLPQQRVFLNLSVPEYTKTVFPHLKDAQIITPLFLTIKEGDAKPKPVTVHSKIARGAFAHWVITQRVTSPEDLPKFDGLGYHYNPTLSTPSQPVYVTKKFQGLGLSVRQSKP